MSIRISFLTMSIPENANSSKPKTRAPTLRNGHLQLESAKSSLKKFTKLNKVFEDKESGVVCYRDETNGELVCEGYDEGPRFAWQTSHEIKRQARKYSVERPRLELNEIIKEIIN